MRGASFLHRLRCVMERGIACSSIICFTVHVFCHGEGTNGTDDSNPHSAILRFANRFASLGYNNRRHGPYMFDKTGKVFIFIIVFYRLLTMNKSCLLSSVEKHQSSVFVCCTAGIFTSFLCFHPSPVLSCPYEGNVCQIMEHFNSSPPSCWFNSHSAFSNFIQMSVVIQNMTSPSMFPLRNVVHCLSRLLVGGVA